jgi:hypothetical protein
MELNKDLSTEHPAPAIELAGLVYEEEEVIMCLLLYIVHFGVIYYAFLWVDFSTNFGVRLDFSWIMKYYIWGDGWILGCWIYIVWVLEEGMVVGVGGRGLLGFRRFLFLDNGVDFWI